MVTLERRLAGEPLMAEPQPRTTRLLRPRLGAARLRPRKVNRTQLAALEPCSATSFSLGGEVPVAGVEQLKHPRFVHRRATCREAAQAAVVEALRTVGLKAIPQRRKVRSETPRISAACLAQHTATGAPVNLGCARGI